MKIALLSAFYPYRGGIAQFSAMLYRSLEIEHDLSAFTFKRQYPNILFPGTSQFVTEADKADRIPAQRLLDSTNPISYNKTALAINKEKPDLLISQYWMTFFGPAIGGVHKRIKGAKRVTILHNLIPHEKRFFDGWANKKFLRHNDGFIVLSNAVLDDLLSVKPDAKYLRIDHPVYNHFGESLEREVALENLDLPTTNRYLLFFGIIRDYKGLDILLNALKNGKENVHLIVAGECYGSFSKYEDLISENKLSGRVHTFNKYIPDHEVTNYFSAADACVLPYKSATQSGITAIAHHFETPIIATDVGGLKENVEDGKTGIVVSLPNSQSIANGITRFYEEEQADKFISNIHKIKLENTWENFGKRIIEFAKTL